MNKKRPSFKGVEPHQTEVQKKLATIFVLTDLLVQELDFDGLKDTDEVRFILKKAETFSGALRPLLDQFYTKQISKSTFFIELQKKIMYNVNRAYK